MAPPPPDGGGEENQAAAGRPRERFKLKPLGVGREGSGRARGAGLEGERDQQQAAPSSRSSVDHKTYFKWARDGKVEKVSSGSLRLPLLSSSRTRSGSLPIFSLIPLPSEIFFHLFSFPFPHTPVSQLRLLAAEQSDRKQGGKSLLHVAARHGQRALAKLLLQLGVDPLLRDKKGRTPYQQPSLASLLPETPSVRCLSGWQAARTAAERGYAWHAELEGGEAGDEGQESLLLKSSGDSGPPSPNGSSQASTSSTVEAAGGRGGEWGGMT
eukprot:760460-Hanusia_phi.AAC.3